MANFDDVSMKSSTEGIEPEIEMLSLISDLLPRTRITGEGVGVAGCVVQLESISEEDTVEHIDRLPHLF